MTRIAVVNVCGWPSWSDASGLTSFDSRVEKIAAKIKAAKADIVAVQELALTGAKGEDNYSRGRKLSLALGWGGKRVKDDKNPEKQQSFIQHGNYAPVATALIWNPENVYAIGGGHVTTYDGWPRNNGATWADLIAYDKRARYISTHLEFYPKGANTIPKYDTIRRKQTDGALDQLQRKGRTVFILADANCDLDDARDGFGLAAEEHRMDDFDDVSKNRRNGKRTLVHTGTGNGMRIIRGACTGDVECTWQDTINMAGAADHNMLVQEYTIPV
jgi:hypothetical protein